MSNLFRLPNEVLYEIFKYLDKYTNAHLVCKQMHLLLTSRIPSQIANVEQFNFVLYTHIAKYRDNTYGIVKDSRTKSMSIKSNTTMRCFMYYIFALQNFAPHTCSLFISINTPWIKEQCHNEKFQLSQMSDGSKIVKIDWKLKDLNKNVHYFICPLGTSIYICTHYV